MRNDFSEGTPMRGSSPDENIRQRLKELHDIVHDASTFAGAYTQIEPLILAMLNAERMTIYQRLKSENDIVSRFKTGSDVKEIRVPLSPSSVAGFVALTRQPLFLNDAYDDAALKKMHSDLHFDRSFDKQTGFRTRAMIVVPILIDKALLGVMQIINRKGGQGAFSEMDGKIAMHIAKIIASKFQEDLSATATPYAYLVQHGLIGHDKLEQLLDEAAKRKVHPSRLLLDEMHIPAEAVGKSLEAFYQVPYQPYDPAIILPTDLMAEVKTTYLKKLLCIPLEGDRKRVTIAIDDPADHNRILEIQRVLRAENIALRVSLPEDILRFLGETGAGATMDINAIMGQLEEEASVVSDEPEERESGLDENAAPIIQLVNKIISDAVSMNASDIHVEPGKDRAPTQVRMRVDGNCREILQVPASHAGAVLSRIKIMSRLDIAERRKPQDGKCKIKIGNRQIELRVATIPTVNGESAVLRVLAGAGALPMEKLNLSTRNYEQIRELTSHPHGIFLVVGPTGSGKTTTLHAILGYLNQPEKKIWTAEDPVEITQPGLQQVQVLPKIGFDFAAAMRAFLRADPDIILIGEMRDRETCHTGVEASLTGHLVLSTLHTNSAPETITRLLDLGLDPLNFADAFLGVLAQRLLRTLCGECKEEYQPDAEELEKMIHYYGDDYFPELGLKLEDIRLYRANTNPDKKCDKCGGSGYRGRTGIHELLTATPPMKELIAHRAPVGEIRALALKEGMRTLFQDGIWKIFRGQSELSQLLKCTTVE